MTPQEEREMHSLAARLLSLTQGTGWEAMRYFAIGRVMQQLAEYCPTCDCQIKKETP